ncbi:hypothetical protein GCM10011519_02780 [Marmoricola endophyticus]|uniref:DUF3159 domain-containing protein n=1 Tax=Marmoricola endophyticus TaxID=2040280 RepID=A0A917BAI1_9ACTN|nr:DUF3159 domain-containing protein [Marmoricola endophyticus]GGF32786.1 hypothetical protein GCM10011519_02780 [Marmoricola endophyticus]
MTDDAPGDRPATDAAGGPAALAETTVEAALRSQLSEALGGVRGMLEAAVPTALFTLVFLVGKDLRIALAVSVVAAAVLLVVRLVQHSAVQFVLNAFVGIAIGAFFAWRSARGGGDANDQALAYFLPGVLYNLGYAVVMVLSIALRYPVVGFIVGSVTASRGEGDPMAWRGDPQVVRLCGRLTWLLAAPCVVRVVVQGPLYLAGRSGALDADAAIAALGAAKLVMGWPLQVAALALMVWLLSRNATPVSGET